MTVAEVTTSAAPESPLWLLLVLAACLPVTAVALARIGRWWLSGDPIPLPLDKAWPAVPWPPAFGFALFVLMSMGMVLIVNLYAAGTDAGLWPWEPISFISVGLTPDFCISESAASAKRCPR